MKFFTNKSIWAKIIILLVFIILFEFAVAKPSLAAIDAIEFGGTLISPVMSLFVTLGDAAMQLMHSTIMGQPQTLLEADTEGPWYEIFANAFKYILTAGAVIATIILTGGISAAIWAGVATYVAVSLLEPAKFHDAEGVYRGSIVSYRQEDLPATLYLPIYSLTPEEIFQGKILFFNVDFFNEGKQILAHHSVVKEEKTDVNPSTGEDYTPPTENFSKEYSFKETDYDSRR